MKKTYHGWIVKYDNGPAYNPSYRAEYIENGECVFRPTTYSAAEVIEFFEKRVGQNILLLPTPIEAYRVYTQEKETH